MAFTPVFIWDSRFPTRPAGLLPVQGELAVGGGRTRIGFDLGYIPIRGEPHDCVAIVVLAGAMGLRQMGIANEIVVTAFGLGAREAAGEQIEEWRRKLRKTETKTSPTGQRDE